MTSKVFGFVGSLLLSVLLVATLVTPVFASTDISGPIEKIFLNEDGTVKAITVGGKYILFDEDTDVDGVLRKGTEVDVRVEETDGKLIAERVDSELEVLKGTVDKKGFKGGHLFLVVYGAKVFIDEDTTVEGGLPILGAEVEIEVAFRDGRQVADSIEVLSMPTMFVHPVMPTM